MSKKDLSADTEVVLLLCGRFGGEKQEAYPPLASREYGELAKWLKALALRPADLLTGAGRVALSMFRKRAGSASGWSFSVGARHCDGVGVGAMGAGWFCGSFPERMWVPFPNG